MPRIAVIGSYGVGIRVRTPCLPGPGETIIGDELSFDHGGKGSNQAVAARRLGAEVALLTAVGGDEYGRAAQRMWAAEGVDASVRVTEAATMAGIILVEPSGENRILVVPGALQDMTDADVASFTTHIAAADICVTGFEIPVPVATKALVLAHEAGVPTLLNPAPARELPPEVWPTVTYLTPNISEARTLTGLTTDDPALLLDALCRLSDATVVLTLGDRGAVWGRGRDRGHVPAAQTSEVVDTTGAGDAFGRGDDLPDAAGFAAEAGAYAVGHPGVLPGLPDSAQLAAFRTAASALPARS
jgi:ribokinase